MSSWTQLSLQLLAIFALFYLMLPSALSMSLLPNLRPSDSSQGQSVDEGAIMPDFIKRQSPGADAWSLCPRGMQRVDCFYEYLRVYARLRKAASQADSVSVRNIGKRSSPRSSVATAYDLCSKDLGSDLCSLIRQDLFMEAFTKAFSEEVEGSGR